MRVHARIQVYEKHACAYECTKCSLSGACVLVCPCRLLQRQLVDSLLADAIRGLPQLPLSSITGTSLPLNTNTSTSNNSNTNNKDKSFAGHHNIPQLKEKL